MGDEYSSDGQSRLDRMEGLMGLLVEGHVKFQEEHKLLLIAQDALTDHLDQLTALVDDLVRKRPPQ